MPPRRGRAGGAAATGAVAPAAATALLLLAGDGSVRLARGRSNLLCCGCVHRSVSCRSAFASTDGDLEKDAARGAFRLTLECAPGCILELWPIAAARQVVRSLKHTRSAFDVGVEVGG